MDIVFYRTLIDSVKILEGNNIKEMATKIIHIISSDSSFLVKAIKND